MAKESIKVAHVQVTEIKVDPKDEGKSNTTEPIKIKVDPPIEGEALKVLLASTDIEVEDGRLVSFK
ncbi:MAG: hypothetical protein ACETVR_01465 [Candidatus Bathyarchaeia archaeon]